ncbi:hypothetical protein MUB16_27090 [Priestia sp. OVL9]|nr:hypothetical protein [Priestia sp. OVL9]
MLIGEIIQKLNNGATYEDIASSMKIREDILKNDLKKFGFHYENKEKSWYLQDTNLSMRIHFVFVILI